MRSSWRSAAPAARSVEEGARLLAAEFALDDRDADRALALLAELPPGVARRTHALRLKLQATRLGLQPLEALRTARLLAKHQGFSKMAAQSLLRSLAFESLDGARDIDQLRQIWQQLDPAERRDAVHRRPRGALRGAASAPPPRRAAGCARSGTSWPNSAADERAALAAALVEASEGIGAEWLPRLEAAAQAFPTEGAIAHAVGTALAQRQLWGKARRMLEQAATDETLAAESRRDALVQLARLARQQDDAQQASDRLEAAARLS